MKKRLKKSGSSKRIFKSRNSWFILMGLIIVLFASLLLFTNAPFLATSPGQDYLLTDVITIGDKVHGDWRGIEVHGDVEGIGPGDSILIPSGWEKAIHFVNIIGTKESPIIITNTGGKVVLKKSALSVNDGIKCVNCKFFRITGSGVSGIEKGIVIKERFAVGLKFTDTSEEFELDNIEIEGAAVGINIVSYFAEPHVDTSVPIKNMFIHDMYIHDIIHEGTYINAGESQGPGELGTAPCLPNCYSFIENLHFYNSLIVRTGWEGIQFRRGSYHIYNNTVIDAGFDQSDNGQTGAGIALEEGSTNSRVYNNLIVDSAVGMTIGGSRPDANFEVNNKVFNNVIINSGKYGGDEFGTTAIKVGSGDIDFYKNTIVNSAKYGIFSPPFHERDIIINIWDNIFTGIPNTVFEDPPNSFDVLTVFNVGDNLVVANPQDVGFVQAINGQYQTGDYHLLASSAAVNAASSINDINFDYDYNARPQGGASDHGAYEYLQGGGPTCIDNDGDGFGNNCPLGNDCNDNNANINPNEIEICSDGLDNDCSGGDESCSGGSCLTSEAFVYYSFDGGNAQDESGSNYDGVVSGAQFISQGRINGGVSFTADTNTIDLPLSTGFGSGTGSAVYWFKSKAVANEKMILYGSDVIGGNGFGGENEFHLGFDRTTNIGKYHSYIYQSGSTNVRTSNNLDDNAWHHAVTTWQNNGVLKLYIDGTLVDSSSYSSTTFAFDSVFRLGGPYSGNNRFFEGEIDEFFLFDRVLSTGEVGQLFSGSYCPSVDCSSSDLNSDGNHDIFDLITLSASIHNNDLSGDLNADGLLNIQDLVYLSVNSNSC